MKTPLPITRKEKADDTLMLSKRQWRKEINRIDVINNAWYKVEGVQQAKYWTGEVVSSQLRTQKKTAPDGAVVLY